MNAYILSRLAEHHATAEVEHNRIRTMPDIDPTTKAAVEARLRLIQMAEWAIAALTDAGVTITDD